MIDNGVESRCSNKAEAERFGQPERPLIIEGADQDEWSLAQFGEIDHGAHADTPGFFVGVKETADHGHRCGGRKTNVIRLGDRIRGSLRGGSLRDDERNVAGRLEDRPPEGLESVGVEGIPRHDGGDAQQNEASGNQQSPARKRICEVRRPWGVGERRVCDCHDRGERDIEGDALGSGRFANFRQVGAGREVDAEFGIAPGLAVILGDAFADFDGGGSNDRIEVCIVIRISAENRDADEALFWMLVRVFQGSFDAEAEQPGISIAVAEKRAGEEPLQLFVNSFAVLRRLRTPY